MGSFFETLKNILKTTAEYAERQQRDSLKKLSSNQLKSALSNPEVSDLTKGFIKDELNHRGFR